MLKATCTNMPLDWGHLATCWLDDRLFCLTLGHPSSEEARRSLGELVGGLARVLNVQKLEGVMAREVRLEWTLAGGAGMSLSERMGAFLLGRVADRFWDIELLDDGLTDWSREVTWHCRQIPLGETSTYGQLASRAARPRAARAVGNVMRRNRWPIVVPCHRVIGSTGRLTGYSARDGIARKARLLDLERQYVIANRRAGGPPAQLGELTG